MMEEFFTRDRANEGIKVPLFYPDGRPSDHHLFVRSKLSDHFRLAEQAAYRKATDIAQIEDQEKQAEAFHDLTLDTITSLVSGWSFDKDCTPENVKAFLQQAPQIADMVDQLAKKKALFFGSKSNGSKASPESNSSLTSE